VEPESRRRSCGWARGQSSPADRPPPRLRLGRRPARTRRRS
jgi:hypothetical protein